jgi:hypothetical protein
VKTGEIITKEDLPTTFDRIIGLWIGVPFMEMEHEKIFSNLLANRDLQFPNRQD